MNEFTAKKLGEVLAFSNVGVELFERGESALKEAVDDYDELKMAFDEQATQIKEAAETGGVLETTETKAQATGDKLRGMMETYIGDEWDNLAELLEWMGFFEGAAVVHWKLVEGVAETLGDSSLASLAENGTTLHHDLFHRAQEMIKQVGADRSQST